jgi:hypothetical protein
MTTTTTTTTTITTTVDATSIAVVYSSTIFKLARLIKMTKNITITVTIAITCPIPNTNLTKIRVRTRIYSDCGYDKHSPEDLCGIIKQTDGQKSTEEKKDVQQ